ncbi:FG-GAP-like repeat-containing protein, partial [Kitasatospora sp. NPDC058965]|uniref:FG-GAP-like repeat-containing protein n=1 Tax=Kitasatospora sp. NPDC058965 TaxID=3346682 RepID=UPI00369049F5
ALAAPSPAAAAAPAAATSAPAPAGGALFDDFHYSGPADPALAAHDWTVRTRAGGPGVPGATWSADGVSFPADPTAQGGQALRLRAGTDGTAAGTTQAQLGTAQRKFFSGTYAARVYFNDAPTVGTADSSNPDHPIQSFYAISPENPLYSELDNEYLPHGGWGAPGASLYTTAWYSPADETTFNNNNAVHSLQGWHTLQMTAVNGAVTFYLDGAPYFTPAAKYDPREAMTLDFNEWFKDLAATGPARSWDEQVNWVYYTNSGALTPDQVSAAVNGYYAAGTHFVDTVPRPAGRDVNGDRIDDLSLLYDYGPGTSCGSGGGEHNALFSLTGRADWSGTFNGLATQWDGPCQAGTPKFTTTGDFNGDGRADLAAFYDYGSAGSSCPGVDHVAIVEWLADPAGSGTYQAPRTAWESTCWGGGTAFLTAGDFNGDGKSDLALLYDYGAGHVRLFTFTADGNGDGGLGYPVSQWDAPTWGTGTRFLTAGDFNGDGKTDLALFNDYGNAGASCGGDSHQAIFTLTADPAGTGTLAAPRTAWESTCWGGGTSFLTAGDFNGDGKSDLALLYDYGAGHVRVFTISADGNGDGGLGYPVSQWDAPTWGTGTRFLTAGDYNGSGKASLALFNDYGSTGATCGGDSHQAVFTLLPDPYGTGTLAAPTKAWESACWGPGSRFLN